jgi:hypothetical protein
MTSLLHRPRKLAILAWARCRRLLPIALRRRLRRTRRPARLRVFLSRMLEQIPMALEVRAADLTVFVIVV